MRRTTWFLYRLSDGVFTGRSLTGDQKFLELNTPEGCAARSDVSDWRSQRVNRETDELVDYQPPQPDEDHEWDKEAKRWRRKNAVAQWENRQRQARADLAAIDAKKIRALTEYVIDPEIRGTDGKLPAERLQEFEVAQEALREIVNAPKPVSDQTVDIESMRSARP